MSSPESSQDLRRLLDPLAAVRAARPRWRWVPERVVVPPATPEAPNPDPVVTPAYADVFTDPVDLPDEIGGPDGLSLGAQLALVQAALAQLTDRQALSVTGRAVLSSGLIAVGGQPRRVAVTWDSTPLAVPTDTTALALPAAPTAMGRVVARVDQSTVTTQGCEVDITASGIGSIVVTSALPVAVEVIGRYIYAPPLTPEES